VTPGCKVFDEAELSPLATVQKSLTVRGEDEGVL